MNSPQQPAYSSRQIRRAINGAAVLGWLAVAGPILWPRPELIVFVAPVGLPIAFAACWLFGAPILRRVMRRPVTWRGGAGWGAVNSGAMAAVAVAFGRLRGWLQSRNPTSWSQIGGGEFVQSIDGVLTPYGWQVLARDTGLFILLGVAIALILRALIGPGQAAQQSQ